MSTLYAIALTFTTIINKMIVVTAYYWGGVPVKNSNNCQRERIGYK
jgi:hypothetical protein